MYKSSLLIIALISLTFIVRAQQFSLYNSRTLIDAFENPSQSTFQPDSSRRFASNFFLPSIGLNAAADGPAELTIRRLVYTGTLDARRINANEKGTNDVTLSQNTYIAMLRIFKSVKYNREFGFAWQLKSDVNAQVTNATLMLLNNYNLFKSPVYSQIFNNSGTAQIYHQFSITYRENYNKRLAFGAKLSYLSGIGYNKLSIENSSLAVDSQNVNAYLKGSFQTNFLYNDMDNTLAVPGLKNPGLAISLSSNYKLRGGWYLLGNLKDLGFIYWTKTPYNYSFNNRIIFANVPTSQAGNEITNQIEDNFLVAPARDKFTSVINGKAEFLINKDMGAYQPNLLISKNLFYKGGNIAFINTYRHKALNLSFTPSYDLNGLVMLGGQFLIKSPNTELFMGTDNFFKTFYTAKGIIQASTAAGQGYTGASIYFGFALKFGRILERQQNANRIPGINTNESEGIFRRLFKKK